MSQTVENERRKHPRLKCRCWVRVARESGGYGMVRGDNLCKDGVFLSDLTAHEDELLDLNIELQDSGSFRVLGRVRWSDAGGSGVHFLEKGDALDGLRARIDEMQSSDDWSDRITMRRKRS